MNKLLSNTLSISLALFISACGSDETAETKISVKKISTDVHKKNEVKEQAKPKIPTKEAEIAVAKETIKEFSNLLKSELASSMKENGAVASLTICNTKAPRFTAYVSNLKGRQLSRVSLKNRNLHNAPNEWEKAVLEDFETRKENGEDTQSLIYAEIINENGKKQFRFMKAITTQKECLTCHGEKINKAVKKYIEELYPDDKAIGFKEGDIRGAFVVINNLKQ